MAISMTPWRRAGRAVILSATAALLASCDLLYGGFTVDNPDNCVHNEALCPAPDQVCNQSTKLCEPAVLLTSVQPKSGNNVGGDVLTIRGERFVPGMTLSIDGVPITQMTVDGPQQITATSPARPGRQGPVAIELVHPGGQRVSSSKLFRYYALVSFMQNCFSGLSGVKQAVVSDLNADGKLDLLVASNNTIRGYLNSGDGQTFNAGTDFKYGSTIFNLLATDLNADNKPDLISFLNGPTYAITTALGNGDGSFKPLVQTMTQGALAELAIADINGDKKPDAVWLGDPDLVVQLGNGDGTFKAEQHTAFGAPYTSNALPMLLADLDGDGALDAVPVFFTMQSFNVLYGQAGGFSAVPAIPTSGLPRRAMTGDFNQDGIPDLAMSYDTGTAQIGLFQGLGGRQFRELPGVKLGSSFVAVAQGDFNGDGLDDFITINSGSLTDNAQAYLGIGDAQFLQLPLMSVPAGVTSAVVGDWDGDGRQDLAMIGGTGNSICTMRSMLQ